MPTGRFRNKAASIVLAMALILMTSLPAFPDALIWPIDCVPGDGTCKRAIGYPDVGRTGKAFNCKPVGILGHEGTDIVITWGAMDRGVAVLAAAEGTVLWVFDGKYDRCPNPGEPDCQPGAYIVCTELGRYCNKGECCCKWCFAGGNVVVIRHDNIPGVFATRYDHLKKGSILVRPGDFVRQGQRIAQVGSAGASSGPHLHFEVWGKGFYQPVDPWAGPCGQGSSLWKNNPPWK